MTKSACVVVLGDIGRSPRMQYHSLSLAKCGYKVDIVGYGETTPINALKSAPLVSFHYLPPAPILPIPKIFNYIFKTIWQLLTLLFVLLIIRRPNFILVQNPPAIPALIVTYVYSLITRCKYMIDWHNYAYSIMALNTSPSNPLVKITKQIEFFMGQRADTNFCVTKEMKMDLQNNWKISAHTLYDRPPDIFQPLAIKDRMRTMSNLSKNIEQLSMAKFFTVDNDKINLKTSRPGIIISSTSWTDDEDFSILLDALEQYEKSCENGNVKKLCKLICIITGKGPLKNYYCKKINCLNFKHITIITPWLESADYPKVLAIADLGICLHTSSSGLDLPMKVVDMFGCQLPVCAFKFKCLHELVKHEENGYVFENSNELSNQIQNWFTSFPNCEKQKAEEAKFKAYLKGFQKLRWNEMWMNVVYPKLECN